MHLYKDPKVRQLYTIVLIFFTQVMTEIIKSIVSSNNILINLGALFVAVLVIVILGAIEDRRLSSGKIISSIAIRSSKFINEYYKTVKQKVKKADWYLEEEDVLQTIDSISRHLLLIGEYRIRLELGKLVCNKTDNKIAKMRLMMDEIGWTLVLMGKKQAISWIEKALNYAPFNATKQNGIWKIDFPTLDDDAIEMCYLACRGLRHIASTMFIKPSERIDLSRKALSILEKINELQVLPNSIKKSDMVQMRVGLEYGLGLAHLAYIQNLKSLNSQNFTDNISKSFIAIYKAKQESKSFTNQHRYMKCLLIENEIYREIEKNKDYKDALEECVKNQPPLNEILKLNRSIYDENLKKVEELISQSIYIDEAYEIFLDEKIRAKMEQKS